jgi:hypothetical protein
MLACDPAALRRADHFQIKLEQRVMQQNQRDGTQPEILRSLGAFGSVPLSKNCWGPAGTFSCFRFVVMNVAKTKNAPANRGV